MRSRYSAFALGLSDYLMRTLAKDHADKNADPNEFIQRGVRYMGLKILETRTDGDIGHVTFHARLFRSGMNRSFTEASVFVKENGAWRYASGEIQESEEG